MINEGDLALQLKGPGHSMFPEDRPEIPREAMEQPEQEQGEQPMVSFDDLVNQEISKMVKDRKEASRQWRETKRTIWDKCWAHYRQVYDATGKENWQSKIFYPDTPKVIEIITAALSGAILSPEMPVEWQCKVKVYEQAIRDQNDIIKNDLTKSNFKTNFTDHLRALTIQGTSVGKVGYALEKDIVMTKQRQRPNIAERMIAQVTGRPLEEKPDLYSAQEMLIKDWSTVEYRDLYKIYPEPYTTEISKKHWIIEESKITNKELVELANSEDEIQRIKNVTYDVLMTNGDKRVDEDPETQMRRMALNQNSTSLFFFDPDMPHKLDEYWGPVPMWMVYPEKRNDEESKYSMVNAWIWVIDGEHIVRCQLNPYRDAEPPYFKDVYIRVPGDWYGIGPAELMLYLQIAKNEAINTKTDNVNLLLNLVLAVMKDKVDPDDWKRLKSEPGGLWLFSGGDDIRKNIMPMQFPNLIKDIYLTIQELDRAIQEVTGANSATSGVGGGEDQTSGTFRGQLMNEQAAGKRFMLAARNIEAGGLSACFRKVNQRIYQFKSYKSVEGILGPLRGPKFEFIVPEEMEQVAALMPLGVSAMETKGVRLAQMRDFQQQYQGRPWLKEYDLAKRQWIEMGYSDPDAVIFSEEEMKAFNEARQQMMGPMGMGGGMEQPGMGGPGMDGSAGPIAGDAPPDMGGLPMPPMPAQGPGSSPADMMGRPAA